MDAAIRTLNLIWLFVTLNSFLIGMAVSLILMFILAMKGETWLDRLVEKHPWLMEERDMSIFAIIRDIKNHKKKQKA